MKRYFIYAALILLSLAFAAIRPLNPDEPYYTVSASNIMNGRSPYFDFPFHQMPVMLYVYSIASLYGFWSLAAGRLLSIILVVLSYAVIRKFILPGLNRKKSLLLGILFFTNAFLWDWGVTIRIYALSILLLISALSAFKLFLDNPDRKLYLILSGLFFTILVFTKIVFLLNLVIFLSYSAYLLWKKRSYSSVIQVCVFPAIVFIIALALYLKNPDTLYFNIIKINLLARDNFLEPFGISLQKYLTFFIIPQNLIIIILLAISGFRYSFFEIFILINMAVYVLIHLFAQMLPEYLCVITPMLLIMLFDRIDLTEARLIKLLKLKPDFNVKALICLVYILFIPLSDINLRYRFLGKEEGMLNPVEMHSLAEKVSGFPGKTILSSWEGYSVYSSKMPLFADNYLAQYTVPFIEPESASMRKLSSNSDYLSAIKNKVPDIIIYDKFNKSHLEGSLETIENNYVKNFEYKNVTVYTKRNY